VIIASSVEGLARADGRVLTAGVLSIGNFDGVHVGHRALLARMREVADRHDLPATVITFFPPAKVLFGDATYLTSAEEKVELLGEFAPSGIAVIPFTTEFAKTDKRSFLSAVKSLAPHTIVVGEDFRFGRDRAGDLDDLRDVPEQLDVFTLHTFEGEIVKSSLIRECLEAGDIDRANALLGRPYRATGVVARGEQRGAAIGFPTANVMVSPRKALPRGVFAVRVRHHGRELSGMANVGDRPTFAEAPPSLEVHLFDFAGDLYGDSITVSFHAFLRSQRRFGGLDELKQQLSADAAAARSALATGAVG
jgi:riboflavin kinase/FMN adenylyltransferase